MFESKFKNQTRKQTSKPWVNKQLKTNNIITKERFAVLFHCTCVVSSAFRSQMDYVIHETSLGNLPEQAERWNVRIRKQLIETLDVIMLVFQPPERPLAVFVLALKSPNARTLTAPTHLPVTRQAYHNVTGFFDQLQIKSLRRTSTLE